MIPTPALRHRIEDAVSLLQDYPFVPSSQMMGMLESVGFPRDTAVQLTAFVPMAYLRVLVRNEGVRFNPHAVFYNLAGEEWLVTPEDNELYLASLAHAEEKLENRQMHEEHIQAIILRSCEFRGLDALFAEGINSPAIVLQAGEFNVDGEDLEPMIEPEVERAATSWWKFW